MVFYKHQKTDLVYIRGKNRYSCAKNSGPVQFGSVHLKECSYGLDLHRTLSVTKHIETDFLDRHVFSGTLLALPSFVPKPLVN